MTRIFIEDSFDSAHFLPAVPDTHKCRNMHGHVKRHTMRRLESFIDAIVGKRLTYAALIAKVGA